MRKQKTQPPEILSELERRRIQAWAKVRYPKLRARDLREHWEQCRDWHLANGVERVNFEASFRTWLRNAAKFAAQEAADRGREAPQEWKPLPAQKSARDHTAGPPEPEHVAEVIQLVLGGK